MINTQRIFSLAALIISVGYLPAQTSKETSFDKNKIYSKSYNVSNSDKIKFTNSFGEMKISTWEKNEVKVDVSISSKATSDARAQEILDGITIEDGKNGGEVFFKTHFKKDDKKWNGDYNQHDNNNKEEHGKYNNESFKVNYTVYMPASNKLEASNSFGAMIIADYSGPVMLESKFGSLTAGTLLQSESVDVEFGSGTVEGINGGKLAVKYSRADIKKVSGSIDADLQFSSVRLKIENSVKKLEINNSYTQVMLDVDNGFSATYDIKTSFGSFNNKTDFTIKDDSKEREHNYGPGTNRNYSGKSGSGEASVRIKSSFGGITMGHNLPFDVNDKSHHKTARV